MGKIVNIIYRVSLTDEGDWAESFTHLMRRILVQSRSLLLSVFALCLIYIIIRGKAEMATTPGSINKIIILAAGSFLLYVIAMVVANWVDYN